MSHSLQPFLALISLSCSRCTLRALPSQPSGGSLETSLPLVRLQLHPVPPLRIGMVPLVLAQPRPSPEFFPSWPIASRGRALHVLLEHFAPLPAAGIRCPPGTLRHSHRPRSLDAAHTCLSLPEGWPQAAGHPSSLTLLSSQSRKCLEIYITPPSPITNGCRGYR